MRNNQPTMILLRITAVLVLCIVSQCARVGDGWGTNIHWTHEPVSGEAAMLAKAYRVVRMDFTWQHIESSCGSYDFSDYDELLMVMKANNLRPYWILDYGNPCYPDKPVNCSTLESCKATCQMYFNTCSDGWYYCCQAPDGPPSGCTAEHSCADKPVLSGCACGNGTGPAPPKPAGNTGCHSPECVEAFGKFAAAAAAHFKGHDIM